VSWFIHRFNGTRHRVVHFAFCQKMVRWICHHSRENGSMYVSLWSKCCEVYEWNAVCDFLFLTDVKNCGLRWGLSSFESQAWEVIKSFHDVLSAGWARPTMNKQDSLNLDVIKLFVCWFGRNLGSCVNLRLPPFFMKLFFKCPHPALLTQLFAREKKTADAEMIH
jgi:hypothetical protein